MFRVGQKVTPKNSDPWIDQRGLTVPEYGEVYTIRAINLDDEETGLLFVEIVNKPVLYEEGRCEADWDADEFRPVVDISDLTSIVTEVFNDRPRTIAPDKFDKQKIHSSASSPSARHDAAIPVAAGATGIPLSVAPPLSVGA